MSVLNEATDYDFNNLNEELDYLKSIQHLNLNTSRLGADGALTIELCIRNTIHLCLNVHDTYPLTSPVLVKLTSSDCARIKQSRADTIQQFIANTIESLKFLISEHLFCFCVVKMYRKLEECLDLADEAVLQSLDILASQSVKTKADYAAKKTPKNTKKLETETQYNPKIKLKGSDFIFQRFKWDSQIDKSQIVIGYLDRFIGIQEIAFLEFKGVHEDKDGIPLHRIRYFKINNKIVWDREKKIDLLTNSGDISHFFNITAASAKKPAIEFPEPIEEHVNKVINKATCLVYGADNWYEKKAELTDSLSFVGKLKILTYNIMSKNLFKKALNESMKRAKHSAGLDCDLEQVDRMSHILATIGSSLPDIVLLQECEKFEECKFRDSAFIQANYFISTTNNLDMNESYCVILSRLKPQWVKSIKLCSNSNKLALCAKFAFRTISLNKIEEFIICNIHLTSGKANNFFEKRKAQMETLKQYFVDEKADNDLDADYVLIGGDFNFGDQEDENKHENQLLEKFFVKNGYTDLMPNAFTFDPTRNLTASITAHKMYPRRLDRMFLKAKHVEALDVADFNLVGTTPFELNLEQHHYITYEPYTNIGSFATENSIPLGKIFELKSQTIEHNKHYLHPSDHYGLECSIHFKNTLHASNLNHANSLAIILPKYCVECLQKVRQIHDPQFERWPPHINILYPFFSQTNTQMLLENDEPTLIDDLTSFFSRVEPFKCELSKISSFAKVVYLEPDIQAANKIKHIFKELKQNLFKHVTTWRHEATAHCTIAQPMDKRQCSPDWLAKTLSQISKEFEGLSASFDIDCIYWITRTATEPFKIKCAFPLGSNCRYPPLVIGLNPADLTEYSGYNVLKYLAKNKMILNENEDKEMVEFYLKTIDQINNLKSKYSFELFPFGSILYGTNCNDFDISLVKNVDPIGSLGEDLAFDLAQSNEFFHIVRHIDALVPVIELQLNNASMSVDLQLNELPGQQFEFLNYKNLFYENFSYMKHLSDSMPSKQFVALSGVFENQNFKKFIKDYKSFQVLVSFVKHWAKCRHIYGKAFGFLGACSYSLMIAFFLRNQSERDKDCAVTLEINNDAAKFEKLIKKFFEFYSTWSWAETISLINLDHVLKTSGRFHAKAAISILQTVFPYNNTSKNVTDKAKKIICEEIARAAEMLRRETVLFEDLCEPVQMSDFAFQIRFDIRTESEKNLNHLFTLIKAKNQNLLANIQRVNYTVELRPFTSLVESENERPCFFIGVKLNNSVQDLEAYKNKIIPYCNEFISSIKTLSHTSQFDMLLYLGY